jgi:hypothetical protein
MRGLRSGIAGTLAVAALGPVERAVLRRPPVFAPSRIAKRLSTRAGFALKHEHVAGFAMRATYGPTWAILWSRHSRFKSPLRSALALAASILVFEELAMPAVGATPPLSSWTTAEHLFVVAQALTYAAVAVLCDRGRRRA